MSADSPFYVAVVPINVLTGRVLIGKRSEDGIWTTPAGGVEPGETPEECAVRECWEEAQLKVHSGNLQSLGVKMTPKGKPIHCFLYVTGQENTAVASDPDREVIEWEWMLPELLPSEMSSPKNKNRLETVNEAFMKFHGLRKSLEENLKAKIMEKSTLDKLAEKLEKGRKPLPIGTVRQWSNGTFIKTKDGWAPHEKTKKKPEAEKKEKDTDKRSVSQKAYDLAKQLATEGKEGTGTPKKLLKMLEGADLETSIDALQAYKDGIADGRAAKATKEAEEAKNQSDSDSKKDDDSEGISLQDAMDLTRNFMSPAQHDVMRMATKTSEEAEFFKNKFKEVANTLREMPKIYEQDEKGNDAVATLHYFTSNADWHITELERDKNGNLTGLAFGHADLGMGFPELGYISIAEITKNGAELDLYYTPQTLGEIRGVDSESESEDNFDTMPESEYVLGSELNVGDLIEVPAWQQFPAEEANVTGIEHGMVSYITARGSRGGISASEKIKRLVPAEFKTGSDSESESEDNFDTMPDAEDETETTTVDTEEYVDDGEGGLIHVSDLPDDDPRKKVAGPKTKSGESKPKEPTEEEVEQERQRFEDALEEARRKEEERRDNLTERERAEVENAEDEEQYFNARDSKYSNLGEDLKGSARHKRGEYSRNLTEMESDGTAEKFVTLKNILKHEPVEYPEADSYSPALVSVLGNFLINAYPSKPDYKRIKYTGQTPEELRSEYLEDFRAYKEFIEQVMREEADDVDPGHMGDMIRVVNSVRTYVYNRIMQKRQEKTYPYDTSQIGGFIGMYRNRLKLHGRSRNTVLNKAQEFHNKVVGKTEEEYVEVAKKVALDGKTVAKALGEKSAKGFSAADLYVKSTAQRQGGPSIPEGFEAQSEKVLGEYGMRGLQWGNSVTDEEREHHMTNVTAAMADLTDVLGLPEKMASFNGRLGLAIGARGQGRALAHYERSSKIINLTRKKGVGTLAHEWGHFFDNVALQVGVSSLSVLRLDDSYASEKSGTFAQNAESDGAQAVADAFADLTKSEAWSDYEAQVRQTLNINRGQISNPQYWQSVREMFARGFEAHINYKLEKAGRKNTYLTDDFYGRGSVGETSQLWPTPELSARLAPLYDKIFEEFRDSDLLEKALAYLDSFETKRSLYLKLSNAESLIKANTEKKQKLLALIHDIERDNPELAKQLYAKYYPGAKSEGKQSATLPRVGAGLAKALMKGRKPLPVGTVREWSGGSYVKTSAGWVPQKGSGKKPVDKDNSKEYDKGSQKEATMNMNSIYNPVTESRDGEVGFDRINPGEYKFTYQFGDKKVHGVVNKNQTASRSYWTAVVKKEDGTDIVGGKANDVLRQEWPDNTRGGAVVQMINRLKDELSGEGPITIGQQNFPKP